MKRRSLLSNFLTLALTATAMAWGAGPAQAYLKADVSPIGPGDTPDYISNPNWAYTAPIRKFVDLLPGIPGVTTYNTEANGYNADGSNNLNQMLTVANPDIVTYPGSDYYEIHLRQYSEQMHSDLGATTQRGYVQMNNGTDFATSGCVDPVINPLDPLNCTDANNNVTPMPGPHHLGPIIIAQKDRPVRVKFVNDLDPGDAGKLFIPVDTSILGSGPYTINYNPVTGEPMAETSGNFVDSRATLHLHGGITPWISDGTPHQWIAPAGADPNYNRGVSSKNVPDMDDPGDGASTFYWTN